MQGEFLFGRFIINFMVVKSRYFVCEFDFISSEIISNHFKELRYSVHYDLSVNQNVFLFGDIARPRIFIPTSFSKRSQRDLLSNYSDH